MHHRLRLGKVAHRPTLTPAAVSPTTAADVAEELNGRVELVLDAGPCPIGLESTVIGFAGQSPVLLRNRTRPQIIYHLPPNYAAMLHSQAKNQNNEFPNENSAPNAPQNSRPALNATPQPAPPSFREQRVKPKLKESRSQGRLHSSAKSPGHGNPHGNKSHKK